MPPGPCDDICNDGYVYIASMGECQYHGCACRVFEEEQHCMGYCSEDWNEWVETVQEAFRK